MPRKFSRPSSELLAAVASGLLLAIACPPSPLGSLGFLALVPVLAILFDPDRLRFGRPIRLRSVVLGFGMTLHLVQLHWLLFLGEASPLTFKWALPIMWVLLGFYMTPFDLIFFWILMRLRSFLGVQALWAAPGLWVLVEWIKGMGEMGFPWLRLATTQLDFLPFLQLASLLGELGVSFAIVWVNVLLVVAWQSWRGGFPSLGGAVLFRWWAPVSLLLLFGGTVFYGMRTLNDLERTPKESDLLRVGVIQANVDLLDKWDPAKRDSTFIPYGRVSRRLSEEGVDLLVWPETAIPLDLPRSERYLEWTRELLRETNVGLFSGFPERQFSEEGRIVSHNASFFMEPDGTIQGRYRKMHLLPFGERLPFQNVFPFLGKLELGQAEWSPGLEQTLFQWKGTRFGALICFESIFPNLSRDAVRSGAGFLVNITNDGWFGDTVLPHQHASMSVLRAVEHRVPLVRCANNGSSFVVHPTGRVVQATGLFERASFVEAIEARPGGSVYTQHGDLPLLLLNLAGFGLLLWMRRMAQPN